MAVADILSLPRGRGFTEGDVRRVVAENEKKRFALKEEGEGEGEGGRLLIRANQGHSMEVGVALLRVHIPHFPFQVSGLELRPVQRAEEVSCVVHGTSRRAWEAIKHQVPIYESMAVWQNGE